MNIITIHRKVSRLRQKCPLTVTLHIIHGKHLVSMMRNNQIVGKCMDMCPEQERKTPKANLLTTIKEYSRPAAGKADALTSDLRPPEVLLKTAHYMINRIIPRSDYHYVTLYDFVFDRLRSIRQDLVIQRASGLQCMQILEMAVRFHLYSGYRLCNEPVSRFDSKINSDHTLECLKRLLVLYQDANEEDISPNREEFEALYLIYNLGSAEALRHILSLPLKIRQHPSIQLALHIHSANLQGNFIRVWRLAVKCDYIQSCALHRHLRHARWRALQILNTAYSSKNLRFPVSVLSRWLVFDTDIEAIEFCRLCGLRVDEGGLQLQKSNSISAESSPPQWKCRKLVDLKQKDIKIHDLIMGYQYQGHWTENEERTLTQSGS